MPKVTIGGTATWANMPAMTALLSRPADVRLPQPSARRNRIKTIIFATDLTVVSESAKLQAIDLAASLDARLIVVNVIDPGDATRDFPSRATRLDQHRAERERPLLSIVHEAAQRSVRATYLLWTGEPGQSIVAAAESEDADLIVVGTRALDREGRFLLGSVSDHVVYHSPCPVLVAR